MDEFITFVKNWWAVLTALLGLGGLIWKWVVIPLRKVADKIDKNSDAVATLQHDRLLQGHRHFMELGWIPHDEKESLVLMYDQYKATGHNHIFEAYKSQIIALPEKPQGGTTHD